MTITTETNRMDYVGNGATTVYPYTYKINKVAEMVVTKSQSGVETTLVLTTDYTVSGAGDYNGGNVTLNSALANGALLVLRRVVDFTQEVDLKNQVTYFPEVLENSLDKTVMLLQQIEEEMSRAMKVPVTSTGTSADYLAALVTVAQALQAVTIDVAGVIHAASTKASPVGADELPLLDSAASWALKKFTFTNLVTYLSGLCSAGWNAATATATTKSGIPQSSKSVNYTCTLSDADTEILHPSSDNNPRTFTIPSNASVPYPVGTTITFANKINTVTLTINADTLYIAGTSSSGPRSLGVNALASAHKVSDTIWFVTGAGMS